MTLFFGNGLTTRLKGKPLNHKTGSGCHFMYNGVIEGIFKEEGSFDIESDIIPFLSTLKGFKFGFNSGMRAEVLFVNTKRNSQLNGELRILYQYRHSQQQHRVVCL